jgi:hypothetical protein
MKKDIEINAEAVKELMEAYLIDQLKDLVDDLGQLHPTKPVSYAGTVG